MREGPIIVSMTTQGRRQQRYDHRFRNLVQRTGDVTVAGQQISFWNMSDGSLTRMYDRGALILSVAFSPDNSVFAYAPLPGNVVVARNPLAGS